MVQTLRPVSTTSRSYSCTVFKKVLELQTLNEILFLGSLLNKHYECIQNITEHNASKTPSESTMLENSNEHAQDKYKSLARFPDTTSSIELHGKTLCGNNKFSSCSANYYLRFCNEIQRHARKVPRAGLTNNGQERADKNRSQLRRLTQLHASISNESFYKSVHCTSRLKARSKQELNKKKNTMDPKFTNTFLQKLESTRSKTSYKTNELTTNARQSLEFQPDIYTTYFVAKNTPIHSTKEPFHKQRNHNMSKSTTLVIFPEMDYSKHNLNSWRSCTFASLVLLQTGSIKEIKKKRDHFRSIDSVTTNLSASAALSLKQYIYAILSEYQVSTKNKEQTDQNIDYRQFQKLNNSDTDLFTPTSIEQSEDQKRQLKLRTQSRNLKLIIGPYAQMQIVYNVKTAERGTSQVFKQKSQGIGTSSKSSNGTSSTATSGRPAIHIESSCSFRIELPGKGSGPVIPMQEEPVDQSGKPKKARKKSLHRCLCTLSFPKDKRKKNDPSAQASQTKKKKITKKERLGKETLFKEKGSSSISKYKESVEIKAPPEKKKENPCVKCCKQLQKLWKKEKDTVKELKPGLTGTNISLKPEPSSKDDKKAKKKEKKKKKKEKKEAKKKTRKSRALKPYECEPGVCSPKVCVPQECYDRKFPPRPKAPPPPPSTMNILQKCCRRLQFWKKETGPSFETGTQSKKKSEAPPAGATVYKDSGAGTKRGKVPKLEAPPLSDQPLKPEKGKTKAKQDQTITDTSPQPSLVGVEPSSPADYSTGPQFKKQGGFSGVQFYQSYDGGLKTKQQGVNIGSECGCSLEFYKMRF